MLQTSISSQLTRKRMLVGEMKDIVHVMTYIVKFLWEIIGSRLFSWGRGRSEIKAVISCWQLAFLASYCSSKISRLLKFENVKHSKYRKICGINDQLLFLRDRPALNESTCSVILNLLQQCQHYYSSQISFKILPLRLA